MIYLIGQIIICLLIAAILGFLIGWFLKRFLQKKSQIRTLGVTKYPPDDLKLVSGIGPVLEERLHELGIRTFRQIAEFTDADIDWLSENIGPFPDRVERDDWVNQAKQLHYEKYGTRI